jgi:hypothetical protein
VKVLKSLSGVISFIGGIAEAQQVRDAALGVKKVNVVAVTSAGVSAYVTSGSGCVEVDAHCSPGSTQLIPRLAPLNYDGSGLACTLQGLDFIYPPVTTFSLSSKTRRIRVEVSQEADSTVVGYDISAVLGAGLDDPVAGVTMATGTGTQVAGPGTNTAITSGGSTPTGASPTSTSGSGTAITIVNGYRFTYYADQATQAAKYLQDQRDAAIAARRNDDYGAALQAEENRIAGEKALSLLRISEALTADKKAASQLSLDSRRIGL